MIRCLSLLLSLWCFQNLLLGIVIAQEMEQGMIPQSEVKLAVGWSQSSETNLFKTPAEVTIPSMPDAEISIRRYLDDQFAFGLHLHGQFGKSSEFVVIDNFGEYKKSKFSLISFNVGIDGRWSPFTSFVKPYVLVVVNYAAGGVRSTEIGSLRYDGLSVGGGLGASMPVGDRISISLEAFGEFGTAEWKQLPFLNSRNRDFNPSMFGASLGISYRWHWF